MLSLNKEFLVKLGLTRKFLVKLVRVKHTGQGLTRKLLVKTSNLPGLTREFLVKLVEGRPPVNS